MDLLELLSTAPVPIGLSEIARRQNIPKSSAFALVSTLIAKGYAEEHRDGIRIADRMLENGWIGGDIAHLVRASRPVMDELMRISGESVFLGHLTTGNEVRYLDKSISANPIHYNTDLESLRPAYCTSIGLVCLTGLPEPELDSYFSTTKIERRTKHTEINPLRIREMIRQAKERGFALSVNGNFVGVAGTAAPIRRPDGHVVGGITIIGPSERFLAAADRRAKQVVDAAKKISMALSGSAMSRTEKARITRATSTASVRRRSK